MDHDPTVPDPEGARLLSRALFFSDAVFAIVLTLLALELRLPEGVPDGGLITALEALAPRLFAFALSFALVAVFWAAHLAMTRRLVRFDWPVIWVNLLFLFTITMTPLISSIAGEHGSFGQAWRIYCAFMVAIGGAQTLFFVVVARGRGRLIGGLDGREYWRRLIRALSPGVAFGAGLALGVAGYEAIAAYCWAAIPVIMLIGNFLFAPRRARA
jgi:uncharacterized membrane protein